MFEQQVGISLTPHVAGPFAQLPSEHTQDLGLALLPTLRLERHRAPMLQVGAGPASDRVVPEVNHADFAGAARAAEPKARACDRIRGFNDLDEVHGSLDGSRLRTRADRDAQPVRRAGDDGRRPSVRQIQHIAAVDPGLPFPIRGV